MEIKDLILLFWRNARFLVLGLVLGAIVGSAAAAFETPVYESTTKILVSRTREQSNADMLPLSDDQLLAMNLQIAKAQPILDEVSGQLGSKLDPDNIQITAIPNSLMAQIRVQDTDPKRAARIANLLVQILIRQNETLLAARYASFEDAINSQVDRVQAQIDGLQVQINQVNDTSIQEQLTKVNQQIDQLAAQTSALQQAIAGYPASPTPAERMEMAAKQAQLDQLNSMMTIYQQIRANLTYTGRPVQGGSDRENPALAALQSSLALYQQMHANLVSARESVDLARKQTAQNVVQIVDALPARTPVRPMPALYVLLGGLLGLCLAGAAILVVDHLDDSLRTARQVEQSLDIPVVGPIENTGQTPDGLVTLASPFSAGAMAFRALGAAVEILSAPKGIHTLLIANDTGREGKPGIAANLAVVNAQQGKQVVLVDGNLDHPHLHALLGLENDMGLAEIVAGELTFKSAFRRVSGLEGLRLISAGVKEPGSTAWLDAKKLATLLHDLKNQCDLVILDGPALGTADAQVFAASADGVLLAILAGHTRLAFARDALLKLHLVGANVLGAVLDQAVPSRFPFKVVLPWPRIKLPIKRKASHVENKESDTAPVALSEIH